LLSISGFLGIMVTPQLSWNPKINLDISEQYRWEKRILLIFSPTQTNRQLVEQRSWFFKNRVGFNDRDLLVIEIVNNIVLSRFPALAGKRKTPFFRSKFRVNQNKFRSILIGKDGSIKLDRSIPIDPCYLFGLIDSMPMRRQEIYNNGDPVRCVK